MTHEINQEMFTKMVNHLRKQNQRSYSTIFGGCAYRGENGLMCAVGCLIKDEFYDYQLESQNVSMLAVHRALISSGYEYDKQGESLLSRMQTVHDDYGTLSWEAKWVEIANEFNLVLPPIETAV
jgi:CII-binding regulator of phage lambda lysogenization HflD